jgi:hypothetical protein
MLKFTLNKNKCFSIKNKKTGYLMQCNNKIKKDNLCLKHYKSKKVIYIEDSIKEENKKIAIKILNKLKKNIRERYLSKISGPCYKNILLSNNNIDIISREKLWCIKNKKKISNCEFDKLLIFSFKNKNKNKIWCFNIISLKESIENNYKINPFTNKPFSKKILNKINKKINFLKKINYKFEKEELNIKDKHILLKNEVFKKFDIMGLFLDIKWFDNLNIFQLNNLYYELKSIWNAQKMYYNDYKKIIPEDIIFKDVRNLDRLKLEDKILEKFDNFVTLGINENFRKMGGYIVIGAFSYISKEVKDIYNNVVFI